RTQRPRVVRAEAPLGVEVPEQLVGAVDEMDDHAGFASRSESPVAYPRDHALAHPISRRRPLASPPASRARPVMTVEVHVPGMLRSACGGASKLELSAPDVRGALAELEQRYPELHRNVCDETGAVRRHINVFVNTSNMRDREGLDTALSPGDVVTILPAVSGGGACPSG